PVATSTAGTLNFNVVPSVSSQPTSTTVCEGNSAGFSVSATGTGLSYQWQQSTDNGSTWNNINSATGATLTLNSVSATMSGYEYRVLVSGVCSPAATSSAAGLTVNTAPVVSSNPVSSTICPGGNTVFGVSATGTALAYQWQENQGSGWNNLSNTGIYSNVTTATMVLTGATNSMDGYQYRVVVSGSCTPAVTSTAGTLNFNIVPSVSSQPVATTVCEGNSAGFSVSATGTGLSYQWQQSTDNGSTWNNINAATSATLTLTGVSATMNGYTYRVIVSGTCTPAATSASGGLTVNTSPVVSSNPVSSTICPGGNTVFGVSAAGTALTYQWQESTDGSTWNNLTNTGIYSAVTTASL